MIERKTVRIVLKTTKRATIFLRPSVSPHFLSLTRVDGNHHLPRSSIIFSDLELFFFLFLDVYGWDDVFAPPPWRHVGVCTPSASISLLLSLMDRTEWNGKRETTKNTVKLGIRAYRVISPPPLSFFRSKCAVGIGREENRQGGGRHDDGPFFFYNNHFFCFSFLFVFQH